MDLAKNQKEITKIELKKARMREKIFSNESKLVDIRIQLAEKAHEIVEQKMEIQKQGLLDENTDNLDRDKNAARYFKKKSKFEKEIYKDQKNIIDKEISLFKRKLNLMDDKIFIAKNREELGKKYKRLHKLITSEEDKEKIMKLKKECEELEGKISSDKIELISREKEFRKKEHILLELKNELTLKTKNWQKI